MKTPPEVLDEIRSCRRILIATHVNPDGDALGSALGLAHALRQLGREVRVIDKDPVPRIYRLLPGWDEITNETRGIEADLLVLVDCGEIERTGLDRFPAKRSLVIDHHLTERSFGDIRWVLSDASSTGEMIFTLIKALGVALTQDMALCLYVALFTDTGGFRYSSTTPSALRAAAEMVEAGVQPWVVTEHIYESHSYGRLKLLGRALETMIRDGETAIISVTDEMYRDTGTTAEDTENFANTARSIEGVEVGIFLRQVGPEKFKASMRSKGRINVAEIAERFGGGGHHNAAGGLILGTLKEAQSTILKAVSDALGRHQP